jgi:cyclopropane fatty-acyl-phospholipid synthase-like methyltransferase
VSVTEKQNAPATERNRDAILDVLAREFRAVTSVLEIGSGTGQHAVFFAERFPTLRWQTSDRIENHVAINAWVENAGLDNVLPPLVVDVLEVDSVPGDYDGIFSANTVHIMSFAAVIRMFEFVGRVLSAEGLFCLYGPFNLNGEFTSASNAAFDRSLKSQDALMGIRDLEALVDLAGQNGMRELRWYTMPANNMLIVWQKGR